MSSFAAKLRAMYEQKEDNVDLLDADDVRGNKDKEDGEASGATLGSKRSHLEANLDAGGGKRKRLRMRENIPDIIEGDKVSRSEFFKAAEGEGEDVETE